MLPLAAHARDAQLAPAVFLTLAQAEAILAQLLETAEYRGRQVDAIAIMRDHVHIVFGVVGDPDPDVTLSDWKAYASCALNRMTQVNSEREQQGEIVATMPDVQQRGETKRRQRATRAHWWAENGSTRPLKNPDSRVAAICYTHDQENPLIVWLSEEAQRLVSEHPVANAPGSPKPVADDSERQSGEPGALATG